MPRMPFTTARRIASVCLLGILALPTFLTADDEAKKPALPKCPVSGQEVNFFTSHATDSGPVYFCCTGCLGKFKEAPEKFADKVTAQRKELADRPRVQVRCPVSGEAPDPESFIEHDGGKVYFCCGDCSKQFDANNAEHRAKLAASYTYQTVCPVMGGKINPKSFSDLPTGERVYWCCPPCGAKYKQDLGKFTEKLGEQGYRLNRSALEKALQPE